MVNELEATSFVGWNYAVSYLLEYANYLGFKDNKALKSHELFKFYNNLENVLKHVVNEWNMGLFEKIDENKKEIVRSRIKNIFIAFRFFVDKLKEVANDVSKYQQNLQKYLCFVEENNILKETKGMI